MRFTISLIALSLVAFQAQAQTSTPPATAGQAPAASTPAPAETTAPAAPGRHGRTRMTMQQRFDQANTTHDGHLTLDQAKAGMPMVAKHFDAIDKDKKGYVTMDDVSAYRAEHRRSRHSGSRSSSSST